MRRCPTSLSLTVCVTVLGCAHGSQPDTDCVPPTFGEPYATTLDGVPPDVLPVPDRVQLGESFKQLYPVSLISEMVSGTAVVDVLLTSEGEVSEVSIAESSCNQTVDRAVVRIVETVGFRPARVDGRAVGSHYFWPLDISWRRGQLIFRAGEPGRSTSRQLRSGGSHVR